jgi:hypothetical protein
MYGLTGVVVDSGGVHPAVTAAQPTCRCVNSRGRPEDGDTVVLEVEWWSSSRGVLTPRTC